MFKSSLHGLLVITCLSVFLISCQPGDEKIQENVRSGVSVLDPDIQVSVEDRVVTLSGEVDDEATRTSAENSVKAMKGVKSVVNNITVKKEEEVSAPVTINPDDVLRRSIDSAFAAKNIRGVNVSIANGEVTLTGEVKRADLTKVMQAANEARPKRVINQLTIK